MMQKDNVIHVLTEELPEDSTHAARNRFMADDRKARAHVVMNVGKESATLITCFVIMSFNHKRIMN